MNKRQTFNFEDNKTIHKLKKMSLADFEIAIQNAININNRLFLCEMNDVKKLKIWIEHGGSVSFQRNLDYIDYSNNLIRNIHVDKLKFLIDHNYELLNKPLYSINQVLLNDQNFKYFILDFPDKSEQYFHILSEIFKEAVINNQKQRILDIYKTYSEEDIFNGGKTISIRSLDIDMIYFLYKEGIIKEQDIVYQTTMLSTLNLRLDNFKRIAKREECNIYDIERSKAKKNNIKPLIVSLNDARKNIAEIEKKITFFQQLGGTPEALHTYLVNRLITEEKNKLKNTVKLDQSAHSSLKQRL